jgi:hypothetical protein
MHVSITNRLAPHGLFALRLPFTRGIFTAKSKKSNKFPYKVPFSLPYSGFVVIFFLQGMLFVEEF